MLLPNWLLFGGIWGPDCITLVDLHRSAQSSERLVLHYFASQQRCTYSAFPSGAGEDQTGETRMGAAEFKVMIAAMIWAKTTISSGWNKCKKTWLLCVALRKTAEISDNYMGLWPQGGCVSTTESANLWVIPHHWPTPYFLTISRLPLLPLLPLQQRESDEWSLAIFTVLCLKTLPQEGARIVGLLPDLLTCGPKNILNPSLFSYDSLLRGAYLISAVIVLEFIGLIGTVMMNQLKVFHSPKPNWGYSFTSHSCIETSSLFSVNVMLHLCWLGINTVRERVGWGLGVES